MADDLKLTLRRPFWAVVFACIAGVITWLVPFGWTVWILIAGYLLGRFGQRYDAKTKPDCDPKSDEDRRKQAQNDAVLLREATWSLVKIGIVIFTVYILYQNLSWVILILAIVALFFVLLALT